jgi:hypothetical protein
MSTPSDPSSYIDTSSMIALAAEFVASGANSVAPLRRATLSASAMTPLPPGKQADQLARRRLLLLPKGSAM